MHKNIVNITLTSLLICTGFYFAKSHASQKPVIDQFPEYVRALPSPGRWTRLTDSPCSKLAEIETCYSEAQKMMYETEVSMRKAGVYSEEEFDKQTKRLIDAYAYGHIWMLESKSAAPSGTIERTELERVLTWLESKHLKRPLKSLTEKDLKKFILDINKRALNADRPSYRSTYMFVFGLGTDGGSEEGVNAFVKGLSIEERTIWNHLLARYNVPSIMDFITTVYSDKTELYPEEAELLSRLGYFAPFPNQIPDMMNPFFKILKNKLNKKNADPVAIAAWAHHRLTKIHPFTDKNGTTARTLMNLVLMQAGLPPVGFISYAEYLQALQSKSSKSFEALIREKVEMLEEQQQLEHDLGYVELDRETEANLLLHAEEYYETEESLQFLEKGLKSIARTINAQMTN